MLEALIDFCRSQWTVQHARPLHQRDDVEQDDEARERKRNRDRSRASAALLLFGEHDAGPFGLVGHILTSSPHSSRQAPKSSRHAPAPRPSSPPNPPSISRTAKRAKR